jgi:hypothetical protein
VVPVVVAGLHSTDAHVRTAVIRAALRRHDVATHTELIRHFADLNEADQATLCETHRHMSHHAGPVLRKAVLEDDPALCPNACEIIRRAGDFELFATLVKAAEDKRHHHSADVLHALAGLTDRLHQEFAEWAAGARSDRHDPSFTRHPVLNALERSLTRYTQHRRVEILDAFLLLAPVDNATFLKILRDPNHACHAAMVEALTVSEDPGVIGRLVELLRDTEAPPAALKVIACRTDRQFLTILLHEIKRPAPIRVLHNMRRLQKVAWLESHRQILLDLDGRAQAVAVELATASDINATSISDLLALLLRDGLAEGRRAACHALARFQNEKTNSLILAALKDPDAAVQAAAVRQLRARKIPDALKLLVDGLDAPSAEVRDAARSSLAEFNFVRYRAMFDLLDDDAARSTGRLVHKVDQSSIHKLMEGLSSPSLSARLRAIEMAIAMAATDDVQPQLSELAHHENVAVRKEAVTALGLTHRPESEKSLEIATHDPNGSVAEAARRSLAQLHHSLAK